MTWYELYLRERLTTALWLVAVALAALTLAVVVQSCSSKPTEAQVATAGACDAIIVAETRNVDSRASCEVAQAAIRQAPECQRAFATRAPIDLGCDR